MWLCEEIVWNAAKNQCVTFNALSGGYKLVTCGYTFVNTNGKREKSNAKDIGIQIVWRNPISSHNVLHTIDCVKKIVWFHTIFHEGMDWWLPIPECNGKAMAIRFSAVIAIRIIPLRSDDPPGPHPRPKTGAGGLSIQMIPHSQNSRGHPLSRNALLHG